MSTQTNLPPLPGPASNGPVSSSRMGILVALVLVGLIAIGGRTLYLQSVKNDYLTKWANTQQQNTQTLPAVRGDILDRNGQEMAVGEEAVTFYATPKLVKQPAVVASQIGEVLDLKQREEELLLQRLSDKSTGFTYVARQIGRARSQKLIKLNLPGIGHYNEERRVYPLHGVAAQILGYAGVDNQGLAGMEMLYDQTLAGRPGKQVIVRDPVGTPIDVLSLEREVDGRDVRLTLDSTIQTETERVLRETVKRFGARAATAIVLNPKTGEILAMANVPTIDANAFGTSDGLSQRNRAITDIYEPGSTFKIVAISAALEDGVVTPTTSFLLQPYIQVADRKIKDAEARGTVRMTVRDILVESSNVGTITVAQALGSKRLDEWIKRYGFGANTGIDFPGEVPGLMLDLEDWSGSSIGNIPIGQGIGVTPIQLVSSYAAIANDGVLVQPHLLKSVGGEKPTKPQSRRVISARTSRVMREMFGGVVADEHGTGTQARIPGYAVGGKTGTANKAEGGVYVKGKYIASFIGMVPAENPQLITLVVVDEPNVPWGGSVAAPAFTEISQFALQYLAIPPDGNV